MTEELQNNAVDLVVVTGMSGAGRSRALSALEDFGYFAIDNLPPSMIPQIAHLALLPDSTIKRIAVACDIRGGDMFSQLIEVLQEFENDRFNLILLFLDASDSVLINRFKETRRPHPFESETGSLAAAIHKERAVLEPLRQQATITIDTSELRASELRSRIQNEFLVTPVADSLSVTVSSFGFKYGPPVGADIVFDVRFLPNPFYDPALKSLSGLDQPVIDYVLHREETTLFLSHWLPLLEEILPRYLAEGKLSLSIALGCTGGRHRSVVMAEKTTKFLEEQGYRASTSHRDISRDTNH